MFGQFSISAKGHNERAHYKASTAAICVLLKFCADIISVHYEPGGLPPDDDDGFEPTKFWC